MSEFQVSWELIAFVIASIGTLTLSVFGVLQFIRVILSEFLSNPAFIKLIEGAANGVPPEQHQRIIDYARSVDEAKDAFLNKFLDLIVQDIDLGVDLIQEAFDGIPADSKPK